MYRIIATAGLSLAILTAILTPMLAGADIGDGIYVRRGDWVVLDSTEKTKLKAVGTAAFPDLLAPNVTKVGCHRDLNAMGEGDVWKCGAKEETAPTNAELLDLVIAGSAPEDNRKQHDNKVVSAAVVAKIDAFTLDAFTLEAVALYGFKARRDAVAPTIIRAVPFEIVVGSPDQWRADRDAGRVIMTLGKVVE